MHETPHRFQLSERLATLLPSSCIVCGKISTNCYSLCTSCELELPWTDRACCQCGIALSLDSTIHDRCGSCLSDPPAFAVCRGLFQYQSPIDKLIAGFKFNANFQAGYTLSRMLADRVRQHYASATNAAPDLLLPVPLHRNRLRQRGFNQALEIARLVSRRCKIPLSKSTLVRKRETLPQTELGSARARRTNLSGAFSLSDEAVFKGVNSIAIIDDVVTTMATVSAITRVLKNHGIRRVEVWCLARASR